MRNTQKVVQNWTTTGVLHQDKLLGRDYLSVYVSRTNETAGKNYYGALLELKLAAALAACGGKKGLDILAEYTQDVHSEFSSFARRIIEELSAESLQPDQPI